MFIIIIIIIIIIVIIIIIIIIIYLFIYLFFIFFFFTHRITDRIRVLWIGKSGFRFHISDFPIKRDIQKSNSTNQHPFTRWISIKRP